MASEWKNIGSIRMSKDNKPYIKISENVTLEADVVVQMQDPRLKLKEAVAAGRLSEEKAAERLAKIPTYIKYDLVLPPPKKS